ncbi:F0F1 ATP synthase subunit delta [Roseitranquillus sediminis]|uniref:F0F1 ATP synthase subunit delta n=1 Tax=Roseitranquillus sediminis TaxID=2809051 RepID=UPI001D0C099B|nr:F0F1 ATP synthase subunit delta [Roseitranquillus sediminis]MBM9595888.1 F0F1 ATP synthase subunit delta [Roseitranquillus sediminis]
MAEPASISTGIASRYATAIFELAKEDGSLERVETDVDTIDGALRESEDFRDLIHSPIYSRDAQERAIGALAERMGLSDIFGRTLRLMASKRRLFVLPQLVAELRRRIADEKGEVTAEVVAATELTEEERGRLSDALQASAGRQVKLSVSVDKRLIGGLRVKLGSKMIDTSVRSKLDALQNNMKEAG